MVSLSSSCHKQGSRLKNFMLKYQYTIYCETANVFISGKSLSFFGKMNGTLLLNPKRVSSESG